MKIFGIGLPKTGTSTLGNALEQLGYRLGPRSYAAYRDKDWAWMEAAIADADCFEDFPWFGFYRELDERYPDAKFILTLRRSPEGWFDSLNTHVRNYGPSESFTALFGVDRPDASAGQAQRVYTQHEQAVREFFAQRPDKLLIVCWENGDGWNEVCSFLGKPVPRAPFPHVNRRQSPIKRFRKKIRKRIRGWFGR